MARMDILTLKTVTAAIADDLRRAGYETTEELRTAIVTDRRAFAEKFGEQLTHELLTELFGLGIPTTEIEPLEIGGRYELLYRSHRGEIERREATMLSAPSYGATEFYAKQWLITVRMHDRADALRVLALANILAARCLSGIETNADERPVIEMYFGCKRTGYVPSSAEVRELTARVQATYPKHHVLALPYHVRLLGPNEG